MVVVVLDSPFADYNTPPGKLPIMRPDIITLPGMDHETLGLSDNPVSR